MLSHASDNTTSQNIGETDEWAAPTSNFGGPSHPSLRPSWLEAGLVKEICWVVKTQNNDEISPKIDLNDPYIWWNMVFVETEAGLMEIVRSLNRSWIYDTFSAYIELFVRGECPYTYSPYSNMGAIYNQHGTPGAHIWQSSNKGPIYSQHGSCLEVQQSLELALRQQPWTWSVRNFLFWVSAYEGWCTAHSLIVLSSHWQCTVGVLVIAEKIHIISIKKLAGKSIMKT